MKTIDIYYVGDEDCLPCDEEDIEAFIDVDSPARSFKYSKEIEDILERYCREIERAPNVYVLYPEDVLLTIEYCAKALRTQKSVDDEVTPLTEKELNAYVMLLQFFGSECVLEVASYFFITKENTK